MAPPRKKAALSTDNKEGRITAWANISSDESEPSSIVEVAAASKGPDVDEQLVEVIIPLVDIDVDVYREAPGQNSVRKVISKTKVRKTKQLLYKVKFKDGHTEDLEFETLVSLRNGEQALQAFQDGVDVKASATDDRMERRKNRSAAVRFAGLTSWMAINLSDDDDKFSGSGSKSRKARRRAQTASDDSDLAVQNSESADSGEEGDYKDEQPRRNTRRARQQIRLRVTTRANDRRQRSGNFRNSRSSRAMSFDEEQDEKDLSEDDDDDDFNILRSGTLPSRKRKRNRGNNTVAIAPRRSERSRANVDIREVDIDDIYRADSLSLPPPTPKVTGVRETFKPVSRGNEFRERHSQTCDTCGNANNSSGQLVYCQGCSLVYHKNCLGTRSVREHLVTKVAEDDFVLQCRRCVNFPRRKDSTAPDHARCQDCKETGSSCYPFRERKTPAQEQREREENDGVDPVVDTNPSLINNANNVLFRCMQCWRSFHYHHLPSRKKYAMDMDYDDKERADTRFTEYSRDWKCNDCFEMGIKKISILVAWRPIDVEAYNPGVQVEYVDEDEKEYLIKCDGQSYFQVRWMPGAWVWGITGHVMRKAFFKKDPSMKMTTEDAIPEEYLRIDIVLDVRYSNIIDIRTDEIDRARIKEVDAALIKYKGLGYEDAVWETVPDPEDEDRWTDFVTAYNDWVLGRYTHLPKSTALKARVEKVRAQKFISLEKKKQPDNLIGGELMKYQLEGLNWIYHQWHNRKNCILADEMGLGKTIQIIAFLAMMVNDHNCFPYLIVVPNSTCPNWRREIKQWAPSLRVVTFYGSSAARKIAHDYELFPEKSKDLRCHVVVTSYDAMVDDANRKVFKSVSWQGLIVDEGQRLKNDKSLLHNVLKALKIPFRMLLTGTPLQNNIRELFNLLQFLDDTIDAETMEAEYTNMTKENIGQLHDLIRPFILRRTKAQVLTFLPAMAQIIIPVSMSVLQKTVYKSILTRKPDLVRVLFSSDGLKTTDRAGLNNVLMQLRKCLCHPFVYSDAIEERNLHLSALHRNLVEASSKLQLLELLLPKLKERGHRVLIFSQFLGMLDVMEDFLDGLEMKYQRLDGSVNSLEKQKRIDEYNAENSPLFAFLLSTRAGGVGINLATADTVIIMDPDFNPHQDIQALSRAHRIGQTKKVLCFQIMTRASAEEKIMQIGRKKMALDHVVVEQLDAEDMADKDVESILRWGAAELFNDDGKDKDIRYDEAAIEKLLDRSQIEKTKSGPDDSAESQFSLARVWANDASVLVEETLDMTEEVPPDPGVWQKILDARARAAAQEAAAKAKDFGRGKRSRTAVDYNTNEGILNTDDIDPLAEANDEINIPANKPNLRRAEDSDTDFRAESSEGEPESEAEAVPEDPSALAVPQYDGGSGIVAAEQARPIHKQNRKKEAKLWNRAAVSPAIPPPKDTDEYIIVDGEKIPAYYDATQNKRLPKWLLCQPCGQTHPIGSCPLKIAGVEKCPLCGLAHYGHARSCPHLKSETMVRLMLDTLKVSNEPRYLVDLAVKYLRGVKGSLVQSKKRAREASEAKAKVSTSGDGQGGSSYGSGDGNGFGASGPSNSHHGNNRSGYRQAGGYPPIAAEAEQ